MHDRSSDLVEYIGLNWRFGLKFLTTSSVSIKPDTDLSMETQLLNITSSSLPKDFVKAVMASVEWACAESYEKAMENLASGRYGHPEMNWMLGYERRAVWEKRMRDLAEQFGLSATIESNESGNHKFTQIRAGRLMLTCSHKLGPEYFMLRRSSFRDSNARLNAVMNQFEMPFMPKAMREDDGGMLNAVIFYSVNSHEKYKVDYLRVGFPSQSNERWAHRFDFYDILENYPAETQAQEDKDLLIRWKQKVAFGTE
ncbi:MAG: hypothetical protein U0903_18885 [Planctomycetales bacterium]